MGHGKETPRQKMIGMMYLVLTALLALNVSAEVLNAFTLIDSSLRKSAENFDANNSSIYNEFVKAYELNKNQVEPYKIKAEQVIAEAKTVFDKLEELKVLIVKTVDGPEGDVHDIKKKDDNNVGGQIMILEGRGMELKKQVEAYRAFLIDMVQKSAAGKTVNTDGIIASLNNSLNTGEITSEEGRPVNWENAHFEHLPIAGVVALMSKMQGDIRSAESQVLNFLLQQIGKTDMKFNAIKAIVSAPTNYVLKGQPFKAEIFIAAYDSTQAPTILIGGSRITVEKGRGIFTGNTATIGDKTYAGVIKLYNPATGDTSDYPFKGEYKVAEAAISVSPVKMNVFYIGVPNPVEITASGVPADKVKVSISSGSISKTSDNQFSVQVKQTGTVKISVSAEVDGQIKQLGSREFRVKRVPDPVAIIGRDETNKRGGRIAKNILTAQPGVKAELENFDFDMTFTVTGFVVSASIRGFVEEARSNSAAFTPQQLQIMRQVETGRKVYIEDIMAKGPDGTPRKLGALAFTLN